MGQTIVCVYYAMIKLRCWGDSIEVKSMMHQSLCPDSNYMKSLNYLTT